MTIQITKSELEAIINQRLERGAFQDAEDVILKALQSSPAPAVEGRPKRSLESVFEAARGLGEGVDFSRNPSTGRPVDLS